MPNRHEGLSMTGAHRNFLHNAIMILTLRRIEKPAIRPREPDTCRQEEVVARHPTLVGVTYCQLLDVARQVVLNTEVDLCVAVLV